ncbi:MAG: hypothetical protein ACETVZ_01600 [Phycisphaerae bacterium]
MTYRLSKIEAVILGLFFGLLPLVFCLLATLVVTAILFGTEVFAPWVLWSLVPGVIIDVIFLRKWVRRAYQINSKALVAIYLFYSVVALGMGMGVPILNFALGITAGVYSARKMHVIGADEESRHQAFKKTAMFCAAAMVMVCCLMALWAAVGGVIGSRFETPILSFTFTPPIFFAVVLAGGAALVLLQYWLTRLAARVTFKLHTLKAGPKIAGAVVALIALAGLIGLGWLGLQCYRVHGKRAAQQETDEGGRTTEDGRRAEKFRHGLTRICFTHRGHRAEIHQSLIN